MLATEVLWIEQMLCFSVMRVSCVVVSIANGASEGPRLVYPVNAILDLGEAMKGAGILAECWRCCALRVLCTTVLVLKYECCSG